MKVLIRYPVHQSASHSMRYSSRMIGWIPGLLLIIKMLRNPTVALLFTTYHTSPPVSEILVPDLQPRVCLPDSFKANAYPNTSSCPSTIRIYLVAHAWLHTQVTYWAYETGRIAIIDGPRQVQVHSTGTLSSACSYNGHG